MKLLRVYEPFECGKDGYPRVWHRAATDELRPWCYKHGSLPKNGLTGTVVGVKDLVRAEAGFRCERCAHPYTPGCGTWEHPEALDPRVVDLVNLGRLPSDEVITAAPARRVARAKLWSPCDARCTHGEPVRWLCTTDHSGEHDATCQRQAAWRILTVHHLNGVKHDLRWWNLAALCQRCHLVIQNKVQMEAVFPYEHTDWFKVHAAGYYAYAYLGEDLTREQTTERLEELLALERMV